jgi:hypothetical protein
MASARSSEDVLERGCHALLRSIERCAAAVTASRADILVAAVQAARHHTGSLKVARLVAGVVVALLKSDDKALVAAAVDAGGRDCAWHMLRCQGATVSLARAAGLLLWRMLPTEYDATVPYVVYVNRLVAVAAQHVTDHTVAIVTSYTLAALLAAGRDECRRAFFAADGGSTLARVLTAHAAAAPVIVSVARCVTAVCTDDAMASCVLRDGVVQRLIDASRAASLSKDQRLDVWRALEAACVHTPAIPVLLAGGIVTDVLLSLRGETSARVLVASFRVLVVVSASHCQSSDGWRYHVAEAASTMLRLMLSPTTTSPVVALFTTVCQLVAAMPSRRPGRDAAAAPRAGAVAGRRGGGGSRAAGAVHDGVPRRRQHVRRRADGADGRQVRRATRRRDCCDVHPFAERQCRPVGQPHRRERRDTKPCGRVGARAQLLRAGGSDGSSSPCSR